VSIAVFDVSEFQGSINWAAVVDPGIVRVHNSSRPDNYAQRNIAGARAHCPWRGWYQYLTASADPVKAAHAFQATLGPTQPGEVMILDLEAGTGDQRARRQAWLNALQDPFEWTYSGMYFARQHLPGVRVDWIAAYGQAEPSAADTLWQNTNSRRFAGITAPCDGSLFNGTLAELIALTKLEPDMSLTPEEIKAITIGAAEQVWNRFTVNGLTLQAALGRLVAASDPAAYAAAVATAVVAKLSGTVAPTKEAIAAAVRSELVANPLSLK